MSKVKQAIKILNQGGIIIFPTDTAFGIGCRIDNEKAIQRLFKIRRRPINQATPVLVENLEMAKQYLKAIPQDVIHKLINPYWPGALTVILPCKKEKVPKLVRGNSDNLGVRMPNHKITQCLIRCAGVPILAPSANLHNEATPYTFTDLDKALTKKVDYVINGLCTIKQESTVIDCSINPWVILRHGALNLKF